MQQSCILLVEDSDAHARLVEMVLEDMGNPVSLTRAVGFDDALEFLFKTGSYISVSEPALIVSDLNLPKKSGHDLLAAILAEDTLKHIRVVIFSSAGHAADIAKSLSLGAFAHVAKPSNYIAYESAIRSILQMIPDGLCS